MIKFTSDNDSSAKNYTIKIFQSNYSNDFNSKETFLVDEFNGNYTQASEFLAQFKSSASKYDFKKGRNFDNDNLYNFFSIKDKERVKFSVRLEYTPHTQLKDMSNTLIAKCTTSRIVFRLITELDIPTSEIIKKTGLSKSDISNIRSGQRHFDLEKGAKIANDLGMIEKFTNILNVEYENMISQMLKYRTQQVYL